ncbi:MAG: DUF928 domain-containing protein [Oscillatoriales cyanobacterium]|nr:MAG: DUF928 domain-containing protein [Oscillatoriales cyanobacterium]
MKGQGIIGVQDEVCLTFRIATRLGFICSENCFVLKSSMFISPQSLRYVSVSRLGAVLLCLTELLAMSPAQAVFFNPPSNQIPSSIGGNSRRGGCAIDENATAAMPALPDSPVTMLPIVPDPSQVVALTTQASTPLWVYIPPTRAQSVEFSLFDNATQNFVYLGSFPIEASGIYQIDLPEEIEIKADQPNAPQDYTWFIDLVCEPNNPAANLSHSGTLKRVSPASFSRELESSLSQATDNLERAKAYGDQGVWLDMVSAIAAARETANPTQRDALNAAWSSVLDVALPVLDREDVDRNQQLKVLLEADIFTAEMTEISLDGGSDF